MRIQFCGADRAVTGSCHLVEVNGLRVLLDFGMHQGAREESRRLNYWVPEGARKADALILSHGHLDHCGKIPVLTRAGFGGPIYCTPAAAEVARIVLEDAAEIQEEDAIYLNQRHGPDQPRIMPLYVPSDVPLVRKLMKRVAYGQRMEIGNGVAFTFFDAGHILGSAYVVMEWEEGSGFGVQGSGRKTLLFTADIGRYNTPIIRDPVALAGAVDYVITESTYGGKTHAPMGEVGPQLLDAVRHCVERRSRLIVPSFAVGRTQTVLWYMQRFIQSGQIPSIPIYVDSPMGVEVSHVHTDFRDNYDEETLKHIGEADLFGMTRVTFATSAQQSRSINSDRGPCVIIASSPTCEFGRVLHHLKQSVERPDDVVVFVGWTPYRTLGRRLQDGEKRARIHDRWYDVRCQIRTIHGLSAHADQNEIVRFLKPTIRPETEFFIVHGEAEQAEALAGSLAREGATDVTIPALETSVVMR